MKYLYTTIALILFISSSYAQHYGGGYFSSNWNTDTYNSGYQPNGEYKTNVDYTFGYSIGYQGLMMENRRFSLAYGLNYTYQYVDYYGSSTLSTKYDPNDAFDGIKKITHSLEIPVALRYNILKNRKIQPYIFAGLTFKIPVQTNYNLITYDGSSEEIPYHKNDTFSIYADFGLGVDYKIKENLILNVESAVRPWKNGGKIGIGISLMKKF